MTFPVRTYRVEYELGMRPGHKAYFLRRDTMAGCLASAKHCDDGVDVGRVLRISPVDIFPDDGHVAGIVKIR